MISHSSPVLTQPGLRGGFDTTQWSLILRAGGESSASARDAIEVLCRRYWYPVYAFIRRQGTGHHEAEDLTQGFFAELLRSESLAQADPERRRFRTFLLTALSHYLTDEWRRAHAVSRGGAARSVILLGTEGADERFLREPADPGLTPGETFDHHWAMSTIQHAIANLRAEYSHTGRGALIDALGPFVWGGCVPPPQAEVAAELDMTEHAFTVAVHRLRHRLRDHLRTLVVATVADPSDAESELRFLLAVVRRHPVSV